jgi:hypothetical protein
MQSDGLSKNASRVSASLRADAALGFVELLVFDVDGLPIRVSRPLSDAVWNSSRDSTSIGSPTKPFEDGDGANRFVASVEPSLRNTRGSHTLRVGLTDAWNEALGTRSQCVLLEQTVNIEANLEKSLLSVDQAIMVGVVGALLLSLAGISIYVVRKHKHRARELVLSFLRQEMLLAFKILMELLDIAGDSTRPKFAPAFALAPTAASVCLWFGACAVGTSIGMYRHGTRDLFIATVVFLPLAIVVSAASVGSNVALLHRLAVSRRAQLQRHTSSCRFGRQVSLQLLAQEYVLHRDQEKHREETNGNDVALHQFSLAMLLLLIEVRSIPGRPVATNKQRRSRVWLI